MIGGIFSLLAAFEGKKGVDSIRRLIIIGAAIVLSTPAIGQGYGGPSAQEIRDAVQDSVQDSVQDAIRDAVRDGILAADQARQYQLFLQQQEVARQQQELARLYRCKAHPSFACP